MKLGYVVLGDSSSLGVKKKIEAQTDLLNMEGIDTTLLVYSPGDMKILFSIPVIRTLEFRYKVFKDISSRLKNGLLDLVYLRSTTSDIIFWIFSMLIGKRIVLEFNSIRRNEMRLNGKGILGIIEEFFTKLILRNVKAFVAVTAEIGEYYKRLAGNGELKWRMISNGINVDEIPVNPEINYIGKCINIVFVGDSNPWFALDRLMKGASEYHGSTQVAINLIGNGHKEAFSGMVNDAGWSSRVKVNFKGRKQGLELDKILREAHIAVGSLGIHRAGLKQACTLKTREYWARGIPFVIAYEDVDIAGKDYEFSMNLPPDDSLIDIDSLVNFYNNLKKTGIAKRMRSEAIKSIDMKIKMKELAQFIRSL